MKHETTVNPATRCCCDGVPPERETRDTIRQHAQAYVEGNHLVPPLCLDELQAHAAAFCGQHEIAPQYMNFVTILLGNALWHSILASIPYERRVFLLPMCLRDKESCQAEMDEFGLLCMQCGSCVIGQLQQEAEELGYVFLVAEGTTVVTRLLDSGKVDAVIGVSCLETLERTFPHMAAHAIPGMAIPLIQDGCENTSMDVDWALEALRLRDEDGFHYRRPLRDLRDEVDGWFESQALADTLGLRDSETEKLALGWLADDGKRWRPLLVAAVYSALHGEKGAVPDYVRNAAIAVECFHKASLVHDDIEDSDDVRYGKQTLHCKYGVPLALNVGDLLIGEGYRLIGQLDADPAARARLVSVAAEGHRTLCLGQGEELAWMRKPSLLRVDAVLDLFRHKTAPAFDVALRFGAICAGDEKSELPLRQYSMALGVAYQIHDDIADFSHETESGDSAALRPSLLMAMLVESAGPDERQVIENCWHDRHMGTEEREFVQQTAKRMGIEDRARQLLEHYKNEAMRSLTPLQNSNLKSLLHRVTTRIF